MNMQTLSALTLRGCFFISVRIRYALFAKLLAQTLLPSLEQIVYALDVDAHYL